MSRDKIPRNMGPVNKPSWGRVKRKANYRIRPTKHWWCGNTRYRMEHKSGTSQRMKADTACVCVGTRVCVPVCARVHVGVCTRQCVRACMWACAHVHVCARVCARVCACMCMCARVCTRVCTHPRTRVWVRARACVRARVCMCACGEAADDRVCSSGWRVEHTVVGGRLGSPLASPPKLTSHQHSFQHWVNRALKHGGCT